MANSMNRVFLVGNIGKDPEIKHFEGGGAITKFPLATSERYFDREAQEWKDLPTDWHNIIIRQKGMAEWVANNLKKGQQISLEGRIKYRSYEKDGQTQYITEIQVENLVMPRKGDTYEQGASSGASSSPASVAQDSSNDDLPF